MSFRLVLAACAALTLSASALSASAWAEDAAPAAATPAPAAAPAAAPVKLYRAHLASYRHQADADRGWKVLTAQYSSILYFKPGTEEIDLPGKGHFIRLFAEGDQNVMETLCKSMHEHKLYCVMFPVK